MSQLFSIRTSGTHCILICACIVSISGCSRVDVYENGELKRSQVMFFAAPDIPESDGTNIRTTRIEMLGAGLVERRAVLGYTRAVYADFPGECGVVLIEPSEKALSVLKDIEFAEGICTTN